jgi:hypothetical protein
MQLKLKDLINKLSFGVSYRVSSAQVKLKDLLINKLTFGYFLSGKVSACKNFRT